MSRIANVHVLVLIIAAIVPASSRVSVSSAASPQESGQPIVDSDGDGLSDFQERHKYLTDPDRIDSDGDGVPDGDWLERREYQYTVRSVVHVMKPVTLDYLNDDYQDARLLDETEDHVELEVIYYPFNTVADTIVANEDWRQAALAMATWTRPGASSDWTPEMKRQLIEQLKDDGIDVGKMNDREVVEKVSHWLCQRAKYVDGFTSFITAWDEDGSPYIPEGLGDSIQRELSKSGRTIEEQWAREVSARGMFEHKTRGSCTSSAIYLNGCLRAVGIPTRTILCIPLVDAGDKREMSFVQNLSQAAVKRHMLRALRPLKNSWASHTFNEVYVGGRWRRLNYDRLGQSTYDRQLFGLLTHIATFHDWADAEIHKTVGRRQKSERPRDIFGFNNPYSTIALRDAVGPHCTINLPRVEDQKIAVDRVYWTDDEALPEGIRDNCKRRGRFGLIARVTGVDGMDEFQEFLDPVDHRVFVVPTNDQDGKHPTLKIGFDPGCFWVSNRVAYIYVPFGKGDIRDLVQDLEYEFRPRNQSNTNRWSLDQPMKIVRTREVPGR